MSKKEMMKLIRCSSYQSIVFLLNCCIQVSAAPVLGIHTTYKTRGTQIGLYFTLCQSEKTEMTREVVNQSQMVMMIC